MEDACSTLITSILLQLVWKGALKEGQKSNAHKFQKIFELPAQIQVFLNLTFFASQLFNMFSENGGGY